jgi:hypothetical protein
LMITNTQGDQQAAQILKLLHKFKSLSIRIDVGPFTTLLRRWELVIGHASRFWPKIGHALCCRQICAQDPDSWPDAAAVSGKTQNGCLPPPTFSPNLAPCDFFLFPKIKLKLKGR